MLLDYQFAALSQGESDVKSAVNRILTEVSALQQSVGQTYATWDSLSARGAYEALQRNWDTTEARIRASVARYGQAVGTAGMEMLATETANAGRLGG
jgi:uncharacterized protein YukE